LGLALQSQSNSAEQVNDAIPSLERVICIERNNSGRVTAVTVEDAASVPAQLSDLLPQRDNRKLGKEEIRALATKHRLFTEWNVNPGLCYQGGDISYWFEHDLVAWKLELEFLARRIVLEQAELTKGTIPTQGDLSAYSRTVYSWLYKATAKKWADKK